MFISSTVVARMTDGVMAERSIFASSHSSGDLGSLSDCLKGRAVAAETGTDGESCVAVLSTADAQCLVTEFKLDAGEFELAVEKMVFITIVGRAV